jgi:hypothetical protein
VDATIFKVLKLRCCILDEKHVSLTNFIAMRELKKNEIMDSQTSTNLKLVQNGQ